MMDGKTQPEQTGFSSAFIRLLREASPLFGKK